MNDHDLHLQHKARLQVTDSLTDLLRRVRKQILGRQYHRVNLDRMVAIAVAAHDEGLTTGEMLVLGQVFTALGRANVAAAAQEDGA